MWQTLFRRLLQRRLLAALVATSILVIVPLVFRGSSWDEKDAQTPLLGARRGEEEGGDKEEEKQRGFNDIGDHNVEQWQHREVLQGEQTTKQDEKHKNGFPPTSGECIAADANVDQEWCGVNGNDCLTDLENKYLAEHLDEMREALETIRAPGCFPHGLSVATLGYYRSGSTLLYNLARAWMALGALGNFVAGFRCGDPLDPDAGLQPGGGSYGCSSLCKDHEVRPFVSEHTQVVLMSHRHPFESVCSRKLMGVWCQLDQRGRTTSADWAEIESYKTICEATPEIEMQESINQCQMLMKMQAEVYWSREALNKSVAYDLSIEDFHKLPREGAKNIGKALGICKAAYEAPALLDFLAAVGQDLHDKPAAHIEITLMHDVHTQEERQLRCARLHEWLQQDKRCKAWMEGSGHPDANPILQQLRQGSSNGT